MHYFSGWWSAASEEYYISSRYATASLVQHLCTNTQPMNHVSAVNNKTPSLNAYTSNMIRCYFEQDSECEKIEQMVETRGTSFLKL